MAAWSKPWYDTPDELYEREEDAGQDYPDVQCESHSDDLCSAQWFSRFADVKRNVPRLWLAEDSGMVRGAFGLDFIEGLENLARGYPGNSDDWLIVWRAYEDAYASQAKDAYASRVKSH